MLDLWEETAVLDPPDKYVTRWRKAWERTVRILAAQAGSFAPVDLEGVEEYIRHRRLAELHRAYAEFDPYQSTNAGSVKPHPGWYQAQLEEQAARRTAIRLGLEPGEGAQVAQGGPDDPRDDFEVYDDQLGPDGKPL